MLITPSETSLTRYAGFLTKLSNYAIGIALLCYLTGFAITNMYLGSLGIVNLDLLKARYILAGFLFLLFLAALIYLVYGLFRTLRANEHMPGINILAEVINYSFLNLTMIYFAIFAVAIFAGFKDSPVGIAQFSAKIPWSNWFDSELPLALRRAVALSSAGLLIILLVFGIVVVINPKNKYGVKKSRRQHLSDVFEAVKKERGKLSGTLLGILLIPLAFFLITSLISFVLYNRLSTSNNTMSNAALLLPDGWMQYFAGIFGIYCLIAIFTTLLFFSPTATEKEIETKPLELTTSFIFGIAFMIVIVIPIYINGIYPKLPQQIGGGKLLFVEAVVSSDNLRPMFSDAGMETYLIDRASNSSLFLLLSKDRQKAKVIEVANPLIQSITYSLPP